jgi:hypothetical protein
MHRGEWGSCTSSTDSIRLLLLMSLPRLFLLGIDCKSSPSLSSGSVGVLAGDDKAGVPSCAGPGLSFAATPSLSHGCGSAGWMRCE